MTAVKRSPSRTAAPGAPQSSGTANITSVAPQRAQRKESELERILALAMRLHGLPEPEREYRFHPVRQYRLDFAWPAAMLAVEIEGGIYRGGGHSTVAGLKRDIDKGNLLTMGGWRLLRFHGDQVKSGEAVELIRRALVVTVEPAAGEGE